jgi:ubiquinone biosynthesis protein COQ9
MINNLTLHERGRLCSALNERFPNGMLATMETIQFFSNEQIKTALDRSKYADIAAKLKERA